MQARTLRRTVPTTPGAWLRYLREQARDEDGKRQSLGKLALALGVSSKTISRWEAGEARPNDSDLARIAAFLELSNAQTGFLLKAFSRAGTEMPQKDLKALQSRIRQILTTDFPAIILDDFFTVRASNSLTAALHVGMDRESMALRQLVPWRPLTLAGSGSEVRFRRRLRSLWVETATFCGSPAYLRMLQQLLEMPGFEERWLSSALTDDDSQMPLGAPELHHGPTIGTYRVFMSRIDFPPTFYLREFVPLDNLAAQNLAAIRASSPRAVYFDSTLHWSFDCQLEATPIEVGVS